MMAHHFLSNTIYQFFNIYFFVSRIIARNFSLHSSPQCFRCVFWNWLSPGPQWRSCWASSSPHLVPWEISLLFSSLSFIYSLCWACNCSARTTRRKTSIRILYQGCVVLQMVSKSNSQLKLNISDGILLISSTPSWWFLESYVENG